MNGLLDIDSEIEELNRRLEQDIHNHYFGGEVLSENKHFELWDKMMELEAIRRKERLAQD